MALTRKQNALIHVAKSRLGLNDAGYRAVLSQEAGVTTSRELDADGFTAVIRRFEALGFMPSADPPSYGDRPGMATQAQVAYIRSLWKEYTDGEGDDRSLGKWLHRTVKVSNIRFVTYGKAAKAITGLRAMVGRKAAG